MLEIKIGDREIWVSSVPESTLDLNGDQAWFPTLRCVVDGAPATIWRGEQKYSVLESAEEAAYEHFQISLWDGDIVGFV